jgi:hypothetical protein
MRKVIAHGAWLVAVAASVVGCAFTTASQAPAVVDGALPIPSPAGLLAIPSGATPWTVNTNAPMGLVPFVDQFFNTASQAREKSLYARRGFVTGGYEGWLNPDASQQQIAVARFATANGAVSAFDDLGNYLGQRPKPWTEIADPADQAVGAVNPQLDANGFALVDIAARVGNYLVDVHEFSISTPDPAAAKALLLEQVKALKSVS